MRELSYAPAPSPREFPQGLITNQDIRLKSGVHRGVTRQTTLWFCFMVTLWTSMRTLYLYQLLGKVGCTQDVRLYEETNQERVANMICYGM